MPTFRAISELCNVVSMVVYCSQDRTILLTLESTTAEYWIPSLKVPEGESWQSQLNKDMKEVSADFLLSRNVFSHVFPVKEI